MRTRKQELINDDLKPLVSELLKTAREKYNYSLEDLSKSINGKKNRQTLHKYETGKLNIPYDILFEICRIFNLDIEVLKDAATTEEEKKLIEKKAIKEYVSSLRQDKNLTPQAEKLINTYKNASFETINHSELSMKIIDDSMFPVYNKNDKVFFKKQEDYKNGDDIVIAVKNNILSVRRLYRYPKGIILQAMNPKYPTINVNIISNDMILGKVTSIYREVK